MMRKNFDSKSTATVSGDPVQPSCGEIDIPKISLGQQIWDSFKRHPGNVQPGFLGFYAGRHAGKHRRFDVGTAVHNTVESPLQRLLEGRHLQMIAIGGSVGMHLCFSSSPQLQTHENQFSVTSI